MIYLVSGNTELFENDAYKCISLDDSLTILNSWRVIQVDTETSGRDAHICNILCIQFGNDAADIRIVVDTTTISISYYKRILEDKYLILQNAKFDLQFLYTNNIVPRKIYDTMIVEQLLYLGYPEGQISYSLKEIAYRRLGINIDKTVRGEIIWRGLDTSVIIYAAGDVTYLEKIVESQLKDLRKQGLLKAAQIECDFVPVIAYLEWCGIYLNPEKWKKKMKKDNAALEESKKALDNFAIITPILKRKYVYTNMQGDLFSGFDTSPKCSINWSSSKQVIKVAGDLGFNTKVKDSKTGEDKDSVIEKHLKSQKGINDEFLKLYFDYTGFDKVVTSFGQGHLNAINPITGRIHTIYRQLGTASGRMSCGSQKSNKDLAKLNKLLPKECKYPNIQQLPADDDTRGAFTNQYSNTLICSSDFSALESRLGADIYNEKAMIDEYLHGSGDIHSLMAITFYSDKMEEGITTKEVKEKYPKLRKDAKSPEFLIQFGGSAHGLSKELAISKEEAQKYIDKYYNKFKGIAKFKEEGSKFVKKIGYVLMCKYSGHKMYWWDHNEWLNRQKSFTKEFWDDYRINHKGTGDAIALEVREHFQASSKWDRMSLNAPTQGSGSVILKIAMKNFFDWIIDNGYFNKVKIVALVHDEAVIEFENTISEAPSILKKCMEDAASLICKSVPIPSVPEVGNHWIH